MAQVAPFRVSQSKRTRVLNVKQSRGGCSTCKTRRVKCDETKPVCQRCERADRTCTYGTKSPLSTISTTSTSSSNPALSCSLRLGPTYEDLHLYDMSPNYALLDGEWRSPEQSRLASLGCWVLSNDPVMDKVSLPNSSVWLRLLPQMVHSTRTAYTSAAAFGAVYESCLISKDRKTSEMVASAMYSNALSVLQEDLTDLSSGTAPLLLSCILLACVEVVQRRRGNALRHLEGAFKVLEISDEASLCLTPATAATPSTEDSSSPTSPAPSFAPKKDELFLVLKALDLQTSTFVTSRAPSLPDSPSDTSTFEFNSIRGADLQLIITLHNVHHFTSLAAKLKYLPPARIPAEALITQGRHLARLTLWLAHLDTAILHPNHNLPPPAHRHALMLRAQCLIAIIYTACILSPYETSYDAHAPRFQAIVDIAEIVIDAKIESSVHFRPGLGIIQPLRLTAAKYRDSTWRRRAVALLGRAGVEGPWVGKVEAAVVGRIVEIEEEAVAERLDGGITPEMIPERRRVYGQTLEHDWFDKETGGDRVRVKFVRCVDVGFMVGGKAKEGFESEKHWNIWEEEIEAPS